MSMADDRALKKTYKGYIDLYRSDPKDENLLTKGLAEYIINTVGNKFGSFHEQCREAYRYYQCLYDPDVPQGATEIVLSTFRDRVNTAVAQISAGYKDISVPPKRLSSRGVAERTEKFLHRADAAMERRNPTDEELLIDMMLYGIGFVKVEFDINSYWKLPELPRSKNATTSKAYMDAVDEVLDRQAGSFPIRAKIIHPTEMIWDSVSYDPRWMVWKTRRPASEIQAYYPDWSQDTQSGEEVLDFYEIWTKNQVAFWCDNKWAMEPRTHEYGMIPILMATPVLSRDDDHRRIEDKYRGVGYGVYRLLEVESKLASIYVDVAEKSAHPYWEVHGPPNLAMQVQDEFSTRPNAINHIPNGVEMLKGEIGDTPNSLLQGKDMIQDAVNTAVFTNVSARRPEAGPSSGYQTAVQQGIASLNLTPVMKAFKRYCEQKNELVLRIVEKVIRHSVPVSGADMDGASIVKLHPQDISGYYANIVELNAMSPDEQERKARLWSEMFALGWVDHRYSLTQGGVQNPLAVMLSVEMERIAKSDPMQIALIQQALQRIPYLQQQLEAVGEGDIAQQQGAADEAFVDQTLATQGGALPNTGQFSPGNSAGNTPNQPGSGTPGTVRPKQPGSFEEQNLVARQIQQGAGGGRV